MMTEVPVEPPLGLLAELMHRCPLQCPYCSNPVDLVQAAGELDTGDWVDVFTQAAALGVLQVHISGGEPAARRDLEEIVAAAARAGLYGNLITSGLGLDANRLERLAAAGLEHVQLSFQDVETDAAERIGNVPGAQARKLAVAAAVRALGLPLTVNAVLHRGNLDRLAGFVALAEELGAQRLELAHVQYYGWALKNRAALLPTRAQVERASIEVEAARARLSGRMAIDYVPPDYYARRPKACMGGWGRRFLVVAPDGTVLPCHAARDLPDLEFETVRDRPLAEIWIGGPAFTAFRGTGWMREPCRSCPEKEVDWGGCRCQAFALTGDPARTDPACSLSPDREALLGALADGGSPDFTYRRFADPTPQRPLQPE